MENTTMENTMAVVEEDVNENENYYEEETSGGSLLKTSLILAGVAAAGVAVFKIGKKVWNKYKHKDEVETVEAEVVEVEEATDVEPEEVLEEVIDKKSKKK